MAFYATFELVYGRALRKSDFSQAEKGYYWRAPSQISSALRARNIAWVGLSAVALFCRKQKAPLALRS